MAALLPAERARIGGGAPERGGPQAPTPAETRAYGDDELRLATQARQSSAVRGLNAYLREPAQAQAITGAGDVRTTVIDQGEKATYAFEGGAAAGLLDHLEACRLEGAILHFSERQGTPGTPRSGVMLDYDLVLGPEFAARRREEGLPGRMCHRLACRIVAQLQQDLDFGPGGIQVQVFFIVRPEPALLPPGAERARVALGPTGAAQAAQLYKYGFHVLVPGVRVTRGYKKYLIRALRADKTIGASLRDLGALGDPADCLDGNSASVPVLFLGSCKRGGVVYGLGQSYEVDIDAGAGAGDAGFHIARRLEAADLEGRNLVRELSLALALPAAPGRPGLVARWEPEPRAAIAAEVGALEARAQGRAFDDGELVNTEHALSTLAVHDPEARQLHQLLDLLGPEFAADRDKWLDVVFALANTSASYRPLAEWFSQKYPKWSAGTSKRIGEFDRIWGDAAVSASAGRATRPLSAASIAQWARAANPGRFREITERGYFSVLARYVYDFGGVLEHYMVAKVLHAMLKHKFVVDIAEGVRGRYTYCFYEFVVAGQKHTPGEVWKWRKEAEPDEIHLYISESLIKVANEIAAHIEEQKAAAETEEKAKYFAGLGKSFAGSRRKLMNDGFKFGIIRQCGYLFRKRGFVASLDLAPELLGVGNGVLVLGPTCRLVDYYHEYAISRYTSVAYRPFDPADPWTKLLLKAYADIYPELDVLIWKLMYYASSLPGGSKDPFLDLNHGSGGNGKTFVMRLIAKTLGSDYAKKLNISLLTSDRESADRANSAMMQLRNIRFGYFEETQKAEVLNTQRLKEIVNPGEVSGRELFEKQTTFDLTSNLTVGKNYDFIIPTTDHGTWRRIKHYTNKVRFTASPDPSNPYEKKEDPKFVQEYVSDPLCLTAMLSILVHFYQRLQREYGGSIKRVPCPTLDRETQEYRNSQDTINRYITEKMVVSPAHAERYTLSAVAAYYGEWYSDNIDRHRHAASEVIQDLENSALQKYFKRTANRTIVVCGCRVLTRESPALLEASNESFMGAAGLGAERAASRNASKNAGTNAGCAKPRGVPPERPDWWNLPSVWWDLAPELRLPAPEQQPPDPWASARARAPDDGLEFVEYDSDFIAAPEPKTPGPGLEEEPAEDYLAALLAPGLSVDDIYDADE